MQLFKNQHKFLETEYCIRPINLCSSQAGIALLMLPTSLSPFGCLIKKQFNLPILMPPKALAFLVKAEVETCRFLYLRPQSKIAFEYLGF